MIPDFGLGTVLPPFTENDAVGQQHPRSPYRATMSQFVQRFATSAERAGLIRGLKTYRDAIRNVGIVQGLQWIDGSFVEACEATRGRPPKDIDVVSAFHRPVAHARHDMWRRFVTEHQTTIFNQKFCKDTYFCDTYYVDLDTPPNLVFEQSAYWFGLFSHQRNTFQWKGLVQIDLQCDDDAAMELLAEIEAAW